MAASTQPPVNRGLKNKQERCYLEEIRYIPVLEKTNDGWLGRIIVTKKQEQRRVGTPSTWIGISDPISSYRVTGTYVDVEARLKLKIKSINNHEELGGNHGL